MAHEHEQASGAPQKPGALQKAMVTILASPQLRDVLLYTTLLLIVATAWVCNRWPDFAVPAVVTTFALIAGEGLLIYFVIRRLRTSATRDRKPDAGRIE